MKYRNRIAALRSRALRKLRSRAGESISETLLSVLIAGLSLVMLAGAISSASHNIARSKETLNVYYAANERLTTMSGAAEEAAVTVTFCEKTWANGVRVTYYQNDTFGTSPVIAYQKKP